MGENRIEAESYYFSYFKKLYESWEKSMAHAVQIWTENSLFADNLVNAIEKSLEIKNYIHDVMECTLKQRYFPVRKDIDNVIHSLDILELKINKLSERIKELESNHRNSTSNVTQLQSEKSKCQKVKLRRIKQ